MTLYRGESGSRVQTRTEDISCEGFLCRTDAAFAPSETLQCELMIPWRLGEERSAGEFLVLHGRAEVVRVVSALDRSTFDVACRFSDYRISPGENTPVTGMESAPTQPAS